MSRLELTVLFDQVMEAAPAHASRFGFLKKWNVALLAFLKPLGAWGLCAISLIDSAAIPMPIPVDALVVDYVMHDHAKAILYCFMAALGAAVGGLLPFFLGRAGGELFLLKRINRERFEKLRDRFEKQEFLAIMLPAMAPPPFPVKVFEFSAGVFEMKTGVFFGALLLGKFLRFAIASVLLIFFGPRILNTISDAMHYHRTLVLGVCGLVLLVIIVWIVRKLFDWRKGSKFPVEEES
ncbi:MAG TPA: VTT domain-containing protein [Granulicella sp.]